MFLWKCLNAFINNICLVFIVYLECSCDWRGTDDTKCPAGSPCFCDQETGQCPCRTGVNGALCNECEDGYWNLDGESGCEPCNCDPEHALNYVCDKVNTVSYVNIINSLFTINLSSQGHLHFLSSQITGQCFCQPEYGGRKCDECGPNHFGNPDIQCMCKLLYAEFCSLPSHCLLTKTK